MATRATTSHGLYQIQRGDTLSGIARRSGTSVGELARMNGIADVNRIYAGQSLRLPQAQPSSASSFVSAAPSTFVCTRMPDARRDPSRLSPGFEQRWSLEPQQEPRRERSAFRRGIEFGSNFSRRCGLVNMGLAASEGNLQEVGEIALDMGLGTAIGQLGRWASPVWTAITTALSPTPLGDPNHPEL